MTLLAIGRYRIGKGDIDVERPNIRGDSSPGGDSDARHGPTRTRRGHRQTTDSCVPRRLCFTHERFRPRPHLWLLSQRRPPSSGSFVSPNASSARGALHYTFCAALATLGSSARWNGIRGMTLSIDTIYSSTLQ